MKLAAKLVASLLLSIVVLLAADSYMSVRRQIDLFRADITRDAQQIGRTLSGLVREVWTAQGEQRALELIEDANRPEHVIRVRWVWLNRSSEPTHQPAVSLSRLGQVRNGHEAIFEIHPAKGDAKLYVYIPVTMRDVDPAALEVSQSLAEATAYTQATVLRVVFLTLLLAAIGGVAVFALGFVFIGRPLNRLIEKTRRVGQGDLATPLALTGHDELSELATAMNEMCDHLQEARERVQAETASRIDALEQLRHADRLRTVGRLASGVAHELGTPLNVVTGRATMIEKGKVAGAELVESARIIKSQGDRMTAIIRQLLDFARLRQLSKSEVDVRHLFDEVAELLSPLARKQKVDVSIKLENHTRIKLDAAQIEQVLTNLVMNALQAMPQGGKLLLEAGNCMAHPEGQHKETKCAFIRIQDTGEGIPPENLTHLFEPFFTTKDIGEGTGLGLSIAYGIVAEHGGWISVSSEVGKGSCFTIFFPLKE